MTNDSLLIYNRTVTWKELLFSCDFQTGWEKEFEIPRGEWNAQDGVLTGKYWKDGGALIYTFQRFPGDIMLDFYGRILPPCRNDLNFTFRAQGWDYENDDAAEGYIGGLNGWWTGQLGVEKYPSCRPQALTRAFYAEPGREYHIQAGICASRCFVAVDHRVLLEMEDPSPLADSEHSRVGLGVYAGQIAFRQFRVYRLSWKELPLSYLAQTEAIGPNGGPNGRQNL